jgi:vacuolar-type H+-ATPase subunit H
MSQDYTQTLKTIKEAEEENSKLIADKKKHLSEDLQLAQEEGEKSIAAAKAQAEAYVSSEVDKTRREAQVEAEKLLESAQDEAEKIAAKKMNDAKLKKIIQDVLFSEFNAGV